MKFGKAVVKSRVVILLVALVLLIPSVIGMIATRVNYDMLNYLPENLETVRGQKTMLEDFHKGAFSFLIFEGMDDKEIVACEEKIKQVDHVATVLWYDDLADTSIPKELLPDKVYKVFNAGDSTLMAVLGSLYFSIKPWKWLGTSMVKMSTGLMFTETGISGFPSSRTFRVHLQTSSQTCLSRSGTKP